MAPVDVLNESPFAIAGDIANEDGKLTQPDTVYDTLAPTRLDLAPPYVHPVTVGLVDVIVIVKTLPARLIALEGVIEYVTALATAVVTPVIKPVELLNDSPLPMAGLIEYEVAGYEQACTIKLEVVTPKTRYFETFALPQEVCPNDIRIMTTPLPPAAPVFGALFAEPPPPDPVSVFEDNHA
jgi:hypothetical protein